MLTSKKRLREEAEFWKGRHGELLETVTTAISLIEYDDSVGEYLLSARYRHTKGARPSPLEIDRVHEFLNGGRDIG